MTTAQVFAMPDHVETHDAQSTTTATPAALLEMIGASWMSKVIAVAAELRIADHLADGAQSVNALAASTQCHPPSLHRLLRALASLDLCRELENGDFALTPFGELLRANADQAVASWAVWWGKHHWPTWGNLLHSVKTGDSARDLATGQQGYAYIAHDPGAAAVFNRAMVEVTRLIADEVVRVLDFSNAAHVVDVGGGHGVLLGAVLRVHPNMRGTLFDLPHALDGAGALLTAAGVATRTELVAGNFFEAVPGGADVYLLKSILHNWDDEKCADILRSCRRAIPAYAKLALVERIMPARMSVSRINQAVARADLNMLVGLGGRERTAAEFTALLEAAGFQLRRIVPAGLEFSVVECAVGD